MSDLVYLDIGMLFDYIHDFDDFEERKFKSVEESKTRPMTQSELDNWINSTN